jgi:N-acetylgalactosamine-N,N'-diacetylbacillosaminyl-diphospho-undecaprenol 4-alpha-N-acetylgalactosaminyltransferase
LAKQGKKIKIALVGYLLAKGGQERVCSTVSGLLHDAEFDVHVIVLQDEIEYPVYGTLVNLGQYTKFEKYFQLKKYLKSNQFDYIIDFRHRINPWMELLFLHYIFAGFKTIYTVHTSILAIHFTSIRWVAKQMFRSVFKIVSVSSEMNEKIKRDYQYSKGIVISNCVPENNSLKQASENKLPYTYIIAVGRLVAMKQFDKLIETYSKSDLARQDIHLVVLGEGPEKDALQQQIEKNQMTAFIHLLGFQVQPVVFIEKAEFLVLTSQFEGFPMAILETLSVGIPVISFDCETGPSEMIVNEQNGLLVENQNFNALHQAMERLVSDQQLYKRCKANAQASVARFSAKAIGEKWVDLVNNNAN